jgi:hypothetical protein
MVLCALIRNLKGFPEAQFFVSGRVCDLYSNL